MKFTEKFQEVRKAYSDFNDALQKKVNEDAYEKTNHMFKDATISSLQILADSIFVIYDIVFSYNEKVTYEVNIPNEEFDEFMKSYEEKEKQLTLPEKVSLSIFKNNSYSAPDDFNFKVKYPDYRYYSNSIYLNERRVKGPKDFDKTRVYSTITSGNIGIESKEILKALGFPDDFIKTVQFKKDPK